MTAAPNSAMLFAAGLGTRMAPLTHDRPKPLVHVGGKTLLDHALHIVRDAGIETALVNTHYRADMIAAHLEGSNVLTRFEPDLLDTGGGLKAALSYLGNPVFTLNTDAVWIGPNPLQELGRAVVPKNGAALMLIECDQGDFSMDEAGRLSRGGRWKYTGAQTIFTDLVDGYPETVFSLNKIWDQMISDGSLVGVPYHGTWCDVGTSEGIQRAERLLNNG